MKRFRPPPLFLGLILAVCLLPPAAMANTYTSQFDPFGPSAAEVGGCPGGVCTMPRIISPVDPSPAVEASPQPAVLTLWEPTEAIWEPPAQPVILAAPAPVVWHTAQPPPVAARLVRVVNQPARVVQWLRPCNRPLMRAIQWRPLQRFFRRE